MNFTRIFPFILIITMLASCYNEPAEEVDFDMENVLPKEKMVDVLTDIHLLEGVISAKQRRGIKTQDYINEYTEVILEKHHISKEEFEESIRFYTYHVKDLDEIYERVIIKLSKKESEVLRPGDK